MVAKRLGRKKGGREGEREGGQNERGGVLTPILPVEGLHCGGGGIGVLPKGKKGGGKGRGRKEAR